MSNVKFLGSHIKYSRLMKVVSCLKMPMELFVIQVVIPYVLRIMTAHSLINSIFFFTIRMFKISS